MDIAFSANHRVKIKENETIDKFFNFSTDTKKSPENLSQPVRSQVPLKDH